MGTYTPIPILKIFPLPLTLLLFLLYSYLIGIFDILLNFSE